MIEWDHETQAEKEEREAVEAGKFEYTLSPDEFEEILAEEIRANSRCCSDPLCPCPKF